MKLRKHFSLSHDEARHSFISFHVALNRSVGDAAFQAGNSETIVKRHYLNTHTKDGFLALNGKRNLVARLKMEGFAVPVRTH